MTHIIFNVGDTLCMKKPHVCDVTADRLTVLTLGSDIKVRCEKCGRETLVPRIKLEKHIKTVNAGGKA